MILLFEWFQSPYNEEVAITELVSNLINKVAFQSPYNEEVAINILLIVKRTRQFQSPYNEEVAILEEARYTWDNQGFNPHITRKLQLQSPMMKIRTTMRFNPHITRKLQ